MSRLGRSVVSAARGQPLLTLTGKYQYVLKVRFSPVRLLLASLFPCLASLVLAGCRITPSFEGLSPEEACAEIGYAIANKTMECEGDLALSQEHFDEFEADYECRVLPESEGRAASDASYDAAFECVSTVLLLTCADAKLDGGDYHDWLRGACVEAVSYGGTDDTSCAAVQARVREMLDLCSDLPDATRDYYVASFEAQYECGLDESPAAYAGCLGSLNCDTPIQTWADLVDRLASCGTILAARDRTGCEALEDAGPLYAEAACGVRADLTAPAYEAALARATCRSEATAGEVAECISHLGMSTAQPSFDCSGLADGGTEALFWQRLVEQPTCCQAVLDPCDCFGGRVEEVVFACTGDESLARSTAARALDLGLCTACELTLAACPQAATEEEWTTALAAAIEGAGPCE